MSAFKYLVEQFDDVQILRYPVPGFESFPLRRKRLIYHLSEAAMWGREIAWDQSFRHGLRFRRALEHIYRNFRGDRTAPEFALFHTYLRRVWIATGPFHPLTGEKVLAPFSSAFLDHLLLGTKPPLAEPRFRDPKTGYDLARILFDATFCPRKVQTDAGVDKVLGSSVNFFAEGITEAEALAFYEAKDAAAKKDAVAAAPAAEAPMPLSHGLNSRLARDAGGRLYEQVYCIGGLYDEAIYRIVIHLALAAPQAESPKQAQALGMLSEFLHRGNLADWNEYNRLWIDATDVDVDFILGFIETYDCPLGRKATFEGVVMCKDPAASARIRMLSEHAQWFEDQSPILAAHKRKEARGVSASVVNVVAEAGDASPLTAIGINLPNEAWMREKYGSKSVNLDNIIGAYEESSREHGLLDEFFGTGAVAARIQRYGEIAHKVTVDMHECIGHGSAQLEPGVGEIRETLREYASVIEEARADLVALYYALDPQVVEWGLLPCRDAGMAEYDTYIESALMVQLHRIPRDTAVLRDSHARNRLLIASWALKHRDAPIDRRCSGDDSSKTFFAVRDYDLLRRVFGELLREVQRIKSQGDYAAAKAIVEEYGTKIDPALHHEVLARVARLAVPQIRAFVNPVLKLTGDDVLLTYPTSFTEQMLDYAHRYGALTDVNA